MTATTKTPTADIIWVREDERGPMGRMASGHRKLVRLDRAVRAWPATDTVTNCRVTHDTAPGEPRGVMFVIPQGEGIPLSTWNASVTERAKLKRESATKAVVDGLEAQLVTAPMEKVLTGNWYPERGSESAASSVFFKVEHRGDGLAMVFHWNTYAMRAENFERVVPIELGQDWKATVGRCFAQAVADTPSPLVLLKGLESRATEWGVDLDSEATTTYQGEGRVLVSVDVMVGGVEFTVAQVATPAKLGEPHIWAPENLGEAGRIAILDEVAGYKVHHNSDEPEMFEGVVRVESARTARYEYLSEDERGTRSGGGDLFYRVRFGEEHIPCAPQDDLLETLGIIHGAYCAVTRRAVDLANQAARLKGQRAEVFREAARVANVLPAEVVARVAHERAEVVRIEAEVEAERCRVEQARREAEEAERRARIETETTRWEAERKKREAEWEPIPVAVAPHPESTFARKADESMLPEKLRTKPTTTTSAARKPVAHEVTWTRGSSNRYWRCSCGYMHSLTKTESKQITPTTSLTCPSCRGEGTVG